MSNKMQSKKRKELELQKYLLDNFPKIMEHMTSDIVFKSPTLESYLIKRCPNIKVKMS